MARQARGDVFDPAEVSVWHCINRCVRRCFLCGADPVSGKNFDHRKQWLEQRLKFLAAHFGLDLLGFAILSNHFHLVLRNRPDVVAEWSDEEVARRWLKLCPVRKGPAGLDDEPTEFEIRCITHDPDRLAELRGRLSSISWFMRMVAEPVARQANREDCTSGRFWQGRFRAVKLCDEAAILACCVYVDLNPIRAGLATTPEDSDFTSAQRRIEAQNGELRSNVASANVSSDAKLLLRDRVLSEQDARQADDWLAPMSLTEMHTLPGPIPSSSGKRCSDKGFLPISVAEYLQLLDWTGRRLADGKQGSIPADLAPILQRLGIEPNGWFQLASDFGRLYYRIAGGCCTTMHERPRRNVRTFRRGPAHLLGQL